MIKCPRKPREVCGIPEGAARRNSTNLPRVRAVAAPRGGLGRTGPPSSLQGQFSNLSKSGKKNGGGGTFVTSVQLFRSNLTV